MILSLLIIVVFIFSIDIITQFYTWQSRIHIGRWNNINIWQNKISKKSLKWLKNTPIIRITDNRRLIFIDFLKGNYKRKSLQHWQEASLVLGLTEAYELNKEEAFKKQITAYIKSNIDISGNWKKTSKEIDGVILAYAILNISWIDHKINKPAYDTIYQLIQKSIGEGGTVYYRKSMQDYRYVDTIGFICPFLVLYGVKFKKQEAIDLAVHQIKEFNKYAMLEEHFIPCHTYNIKTNLPIGLFGWGRGLGWYAIGLIDAWNVLPNDSLDKLNLTKDVISFAKMALKYQNENGSWNWLVTSKESRADSSTTATLAWFLINAAKIKEIRSECKLAKEKALTFLMKVTRRDGAIDFSQGDTKGIGVYSQNFDVLPFTQGFVLRTSCFKSI